MCRIRCNGRRVMRKKKKSGQGRMCRTVTSSRTKLTIIERWLPRGKGKKKGNTAAARLTRWGREEEQKMVVASWHGSYGSIDENVLTVLVCPTIVVPTSFSALSVSDDPIREQGR